jgi:hypothetical protein
MTNSNDEARTFAAHGPRVVAIPRQRGYAKTSATGDHEQDGDDAIAEVEGFKALLPEEWFEARYLGHETAFIFNSPKCYGSRSSMATIAAQPCSERFGCVDSKVVPVRMAALPCTLEASCTRPSYDCSTFAAEPTASPFGRYGTCFSGFDCGPSRPTTSNGRSPNTIATRPSMPSKEVSDAAGPLTWTLTYTYSSTRTCICTCFESMGARAPQRLQRVPLAK